MFCDSIPFPTRIHGRGIGRSAVNLTVTSRGSRIYGSKSRDTVKKRRHGQNSGVHMANLKDARYVTLYPYNRSQILQYVKYTKLINIVKGIANFCDK